MSVLVKIKYLLSEEGRRDSLRRGQNGHRVQEVTGHVEDALRHLDEAIRMNPAIRFQARNDSDFQNLAEDPRFTELLYPDPGADSAPADASEFEQ